MINKGEFNKAIEIIDDLLLTNKFSEEESFSLKFLKSTAYIELGDFKKGIEESKQIFNESRLYEKRFFEVDALLNMYDGYCRMGSKDEANRLVKNIEELIKSLKKVDSKKTLEKRSRFYRLQGDFYFAKSDYDSSLGFYNKSLEDGEKIKHNLLIAWALNNIGNIFYYKQNLKKAKDYYERSYKLRVKENVTKDIIKSIGNLGIIYYVLGESDKSLEFYKEGLSLIKDQGKIETKARFLSYIGMVYQQKGNLDDADNHYRKSLAIHEELNNLKEKAFTLTNLGQISYLKGDIDKALDYFVSSLDIKSKFEDKKELAISYDMIGNLYLIKGELEDALEYFEIAMIIKEKIDFKLGLIDSYISFGEVSFESNDFFAAEDYFMKALTQVESNLIVKANILYLLIKLHLQRNNFDTANEYLLDLGNICNDCENDLISFQYELAKINIQTASNESQTDDCLEKLRDMLYNDNINNYPLLIDAMKSLAILLYKKLVNSENKLILDELKNGILQMRDIAEKKHFITLIIESRILDTKVKLLDDNYNIEKAEEELYQISYIASSKKLNRLGRVIKKEIKSLQKTKIRWNEFITSDNNFSISQKLDLIKIDKSLARISVNNSIIL